MSSAANITRILLFVVLASSAYAVTDCIDINVSGAYVLENSITDTAALKCINITVSNVALNGAGFTVDGTDTAMSVGIYAYNSSVALNNITIGNISVTDFSTGINMVSVQNSSVLDSTVASNAREGLVANWSVGITVSGVHAENNTASGASFDAGIHFVSVNSSTISNSVALGNSPRYNIVVWPGYDINITNNTALNTARCFYLITINRGVVSYNNISNCTTDGIDFFQISNFTVFGNNVTGSATIGIMSQTGSNSLFYGNTVMNGGGIDIRGSTNNTYENNTVYNTTKSCFASISNPGNTLETYRNNLAYNCTLYGFNVTNTTNSLYENNIAYGNGNAAATAGFYLGASSSNITLLNNTAYNNTNNGFRAISSGHNLTGNTAYNNAANGFYLDTPATSNTLANNIAYNNSNNGFSLNQGANGNTLINNTAHNNSGSGFFIFSNLNTFTNNTVYNHRNNAHSAGFWFWDGSNNTLTGNTVYNNSPYGFFVFNSSDNNFTGTIAYGNSDYGIYLSSYDPVYAFSEGDSVKNIFTNTFIYNQSYYIYQYAMASSSNNFTNLTLGYNSTIGLLNFQFLNITDLFLNSTNLKLDPYFVSLNDSSATQANLSANITLYSVCNSTVEPSVYKLAGFPSSRAEIVSGGSVYPTETSCGSGTMTFDALGFSGYALGPITTTLSLNLSPSNLTTYRTETNVSCTADNGVVAIGLYVNGTLVAGPSTNSIEYLTNHSGGYYNYTCNTTGNENYSEAVNASVLYTQRASPTITFNVTPSTPTTVGNETNLSCSVDNTQATVGIFVDDVSVGSAVQQFEYLNNLTVGTYNFTCNTTGNENYTNASGSLNGYEVEQRDTVLDLTIPLLPLAGEQTDVSCSANTDEVNISLYRNGVRVANGTVQVDDIAVLPPALYTYVCNTTGSDNYTSYSTSGILRFKRSSTSSSAAQCNLEVVVPEGAVAGSAVQLQVLRSTDGNPGTSVYLATVAIAGEGEAATLTTGTNGHVSFVPASAGTYSYAAEFGDCEGADGAFTVVEPEEELPVEEEPAAPPEEPSAEPSGGETSGSTGQPVGTETPAETTPECIVDSDCGAGFGCEGGACVEAGGQPAAEGGETQATGNPEQETGNREGVPWWAWLIILIVLGAGAYWFLSRKKA